MLTVYTIDCNGTYIYLPEGMNDSYTLEQVACTNATLEMEDCKSGSLTFSIMPTNNAYNSITLMSSIIKVVEHTYKGSSSSGSSQTIFKGRAISCEEDLTGKRTYTCEGALAFLNDIIQLGNGYNTSTISSDGSGGFEQSSTQAGLVKKYFEYLLNHTADKANGSVSKYTDDPPFAALNAGSGYNRKVDSARKIQVGKVTKVPGIVAYVKADPDHGNVPAHYELNSSPQVAESVLDRIFRTCVDPDGGHLNISYSGDTACLDYVDGYNEVQNGRVEYGENILSLTKKTSVDDPATWILPRGQSYTKSNVGVNDNSNGVKVQRTIDQTLYTSVSTGADSDETGIFVRNAPLTYKYGRYEKIVDFPDLKDVSDDYKEANKALIKASSEWFNSYTFETVEIEVQMLDLGRVADYDYPPLHILDQVQVVSSHNDINAAFPVIKLSIDLLNPANTVITLNKVIKTEASRYLSSKLNEQKDIKANVKSNTDLIHQNATSNNPVEEVISKYSDGLIDNHGADLGLSADDISHKHLIEYDYNSFVNPGNNPLDGYITFFNNGSCRSLTGPYYFGGPLDSRNSRSSQFKGINILGHNWVMKSFASKIDSDIWAHLSLGVVYLFKSNGENYINFYPMSPVMGCYTSSSLPIYGYNRMDSSYYSLTATIGYNDDDVRTLAWNFNKSMADAYLYLMKTNFSNFTIRNNVSLDLKAYDSSSRSYYTFSNTFVPAIFASNCGGGRIHPGYMVDLQRGYYNGGQINYCNSFIGGAVYRGDSDYGDDSDFKPVPGSIRFEVGEGSSEKLKYTGSMAPKLYVFYDMDKFNALQQEIEAKYIAK